MDSIEEYFKGLSKEEILRRNKERHDLFKSNKMATIPQYILDFEVRGLVLRYHAYNKAFEIAMKDGSEKTAIFYDASRAAIYTIIQALIPYVTNPEEELKLWGEKLPEKQLNEGL